MKRIFILIFLFVCANTHAKKLKLTLEEAVYLSVRRHPDIQISRLDAELQENALQLALWKFKPHFLLNAELGETKPLFADGERHYQPFSNAGLRTSLNTPYGTQLEMSLNPIFSGDNKGWGLTASISQPLVKGFGRAIVEAELENTRDQYKINRLMAKNTLQRVINRVIEMYLSYDYMQKLILLDEETVTRARKSLKQTEYFIQAGKKAGQERVTAKAYLARATIQLQDDRARLLEARQQLLLAIGLNVHVDYDIHPLSLDTIQNKIKIRHDSSLIRCILNNDIQGIIDKITLRGMIARGVVSARDQTRWDVSLKLIANTHDQSKLIRNTEPDQTALLAINVPIDDLALNQNVRSAEIALKKAEIALQRQQQEKYLEAQTTLNQITSLKQSVQLAQYALRLERQAHQLSTQKYEHGLIDGLTLGIAENQLKQAEWSMRNTELNYIRALISVDGLLGHTLYTWNVPTSLPNTNRCGEDTT